MENITEAEAIELYRKKDDVKELIDRHQQRIQDQIDSLQREGNNFNRMMFQEIESWEQMINEFQSNINTLGDINELKKALNGLLKHNRSRIDSERHNVENHDFNNALINLRHAKLNLDNSISDLKDKLYSMSTLNEILEKRKEEIEHRDKRQFSETWPMPKYAMTMASVGFGAFTTSMAYLLLTGFDAEWHFVFLPFFCFLISLIGFDIWRAHELGKIEYYKSLDDKFRIASGKYIGYFERFWYWLIAQFNKEIPLYIEEMNEAQLRHERWKYSFITTIVIATCLASANLINCYQSGHHLFETIVKIIFAIMAIISFYLFFRYVKSIIFISKKLDEKLVMVMRRLKIKVKQFQNRLQIMLKGKMVPLD